MAKNPFWPWGRKKEQRSSQTFFSLPVPWGTYVSKAPLENSLVYSAVSLISGNIGTFPIKLFDEKKSLDGHPIGHLLKRPNDYSTASTFWSTVALSLTLKGRAFIYKEKDQSGRTKALHILNADTVKVSLQGLKKVFTIGNTAYTERDIIHIVGLSTDGLDGLSPIELNKGSLDLGKTLESYSRNFFKNGAQPSGVLTTSGTLDDETIERLKEQFSQRYTGDNNSHKPMILEAGLSFVPITVNAKEAMLLESRSFSVTEVARIFHIPPHLLGDLTKSSYSSIEAQGREFVTYTLRPYIVRIEQALEKGLLQDEPFSIRFNADALLRGSLKDRFDAYRVGISSGFMTPNEARILEDMEQKEGGDSLYTPLNMIPSDDLAQLQEDKK